MNFLSGGNNQQPAPQAGQAQAVKQAVMEMDSMMGLFDKMGSMCFTKCVHKMSDNELQIGEMSCIDRCVGKYMEAQQKVGGVLSRLEQSMAAAQG